MKRKVIWNIALDLNFRRKKLGTPVKELNGEEGEGVVGSLRLLADNPGQAQS